MPARRTTAPPRRCTPTPRRRAPLFSSDPPPVTSARRGGPSGTTVLCTASALVAFAANSVLCLLALGRAEIDAASFSTIRLASGSFALLLLSLGLRGRSLRIGGNWGSAALPFLYAIPLSFGYRSLGAWTGALVRFGSLQ